MALFVVSTPIGNLEDISFRALRILKEASVIACEDTRRTQKILQYYQIKNRLISYHAHSNEKRTLEIVEDLRSGKDVALVSDSGTPGISDPGWDLINRAITHGIQVQTVPGPSAVAAACSCSGLPCDRFVFLGFLPRRKGRAARMLTSAYELQHTVVLYESPYRVSSTLGTLAELFGRNITVVVARELTKKFEEMIRGTVHDVQEILKGRKILGEVVILFKKSD